MSYADGLKQKKHGANQPPIANTTAGPGIKKQKVSGSKLITGKKRRRGL